MSKKDLMNQMVKSQFNRVEKNAEIFKAELTDKLQSSDAHTKAAVESFTEDASLETANKLSIAIQSDKKLSPAVKDDALKLIADMIKTNFDNASLSSDYNTLKQECKYLAHLSSYTFILLARRLKMIRDNQFYKNDGYNTFKEFIDKELDIAKQTVYFYIKVFEILEVSPGRLQNQPIEYTKIKPFVSILDKLPEEDRSSELDNILDIVNTKSRSELEKYAEELRAKYNLSLNYFTNAWEKKIDRYYSEIYHHLDQIDPQKLLWFSEQIQRLTTQKNK